ncbi:uncharacterized protein TNCV_4859381 [Trichonephila clavipes]|nr:uncharacterized protein TNCV_4859381 [Trichonephila clavipes]
MIVQFRNEKVSNHGSIPITIDCNVVAFIVFEEGFHQPIKRTKHVLSGREGMNVVRDCEKVGLLYDRWRHHLSPPPQFRHGTGGEGNILQPPALVVSAATAHKTFEPTDLTSTYSVCTRRVFGSIGHRTQAFRSGVRCPNH